MTDQINTLQFDFSEIHTIADFYEEFRSQTTLPEYFGDNLDALFDVLTGFLELPLHIEFDNLNPFQLETFDSLIATIEDASGETSGLTFAYFMTRY